jgi:hypothetical protein
MPVLFCPASRRWLPFGTMAPNYVADRFKTDVRMLARFGQARDWHETGFAQTPVCNIPRGDAPQGARHQAHKGIYRSTKLAVFVLDARKEPLRPCSEKRARLLLTRDRAVVVHRRACGAGSVAVRARGSFTVGNADGIKAKVLQNSPLRGRLRPAARASSPP